MPSWWTPVTLLPCPSLCPALSSTTAQGTGPRTTRSQPAEHRSICRKRRRCGGRDRRKLWKRRSWPWSAPCPRAPCRHRLCSSDPRHLLPLQLPTKQEPHTVHPHVSAAATEIARRTRSPRTICTLALLSELLEAPPTANTQATRERTNARSTRCNTERQANNGTAHHLHRLPGSGLLGEGAAEAKKTAMLLSLLNDRLTTSKGNGKWGRPGCTTAGL